MNFDAAGGRRFIFTAAVFLASCLLLWFGHLTGEQWVGLQPLLLGIYAGANVAQRGVEAARDVKAAAAPDSPQ